MQKAVIAITNPPNTGVRLTVTSERVRYSPLPTAYSSEYMQMQISTAGGMYSLYFFCTNTGTLMSASSKRVNSA